MIKPCRVRRRGLTLVEMIATITILAIVAATVLPVVEAAGAHYAESAALRRTADQVSFAIDRVSRVLREVPITEEKDGLAIASIEPNAITLDDGTAIRLDGDRVLLEIGGRAGVVCEGVSEFEIIAFGDDGITPTRDAPRDTRRIDIGISVGGLTFRSAVFPRAGMGGS